MTPPSTLPRHSPLEAEMLIHLRAADVELVKLFKARRRKKKGITSWELEKRFGPKWANAIARLRRRGFVINAKPWKWNNKLYTLIDLPDWASGSAAATGSLSSPSTSHSRTVEVAEPEAQSALFDLCEEPISAATADYEPEGEAA